MGPKVDAVCRFVEASGRPGVIISLGEILSGVRGAAGTRVMPDAEAATRPGQATVKRAV
jgi:carbamate kinase